MRSDRFESISIDRRSSVSYDDQIKESIKALILDQTFLLSSCNGSQVKR